MPSISRLLREVVVALLLAPFAANSQSGTWTTRAPLPAARSGIGVGELSGRLYAVGGFTGNTTNNSVALVDSYDPSTNTWTSRAPLPSERTAVAVVSVDGVLYAIGGSTFGTGGLNNVEAYNPSTNTWTSRAPMPGQGRAVSGVGVIDAVIYVVGGFTGAANTLVNTVQAYNPATNTWTTKAPLPAPLYSFASAAFNGKLYVFGGSEDGGTTATNKAYVYDSVANAWTSIAALPTARLSLGAGVVGSRIYVSGGYVPIGPSATPEAAWQSYDPATNTWRAETAWSNPRFNAAVGAANGAVYMIGGQGPAPNYNAVGNVDAFTPATPPSPLVHALSVTITGAGTVSSSPPGIACASPNCSASFDAGTMVTLTASPSAGATFAGWSGTDCSGTGVCTVTMNAAKSIGAAFNALPGVLMATPSSVDFGAQSMRTSAARVVLLKNDGMSALTVTSVGSTPGFAIAHACGDLAAGASCGVTVTFAPISQTEATGVLTISSTGGNLAIPLSGMGERSLVVHYYGSILRRAPDPGGKAYWEGEAARVQTLGANINETWFSMAASFYRSAEYLAQNRNSTGYVTDLYNTFFNRVPDSGGLTYWSGLLDSGMPREVVLVSFMFSVEFSGFTRSIFGNPAARAEIDTVIDFYRGILGRLPDSGGFDYWVARFRTAQCEGSASVYAAVDAISSDFMKGPEYAGRGRNNPQYVGDLYNAFLRRGGDLGGVQHWIRQLDIGAESRESLRKAFLASPEFTARIAQVLAEGCHSVGTSQTLLEGSYRYGGTFPAPAPVTYLDHDGVSVTHPRAYPGFVLLQTANTSEASVASLLSPHGGTIVAAVPPVGQFMVKVPNTGAFIAAVRGLSWAEGVWPVQPLEMGLQLLALDGVGPTSESQCLRNHGPYVVEIMSRRSATPGSFVDVLGRDELEISWELGYRMYEAQKRGERLIVNISMQSASSAARCQTAGACQAARNGQFEFLRTMVKMMQINADVQPERADNALVTVIAGNAGAPLDLQLKLLKLLYPKGFERVLVVGGTAPNQVIDTRFNYLAGTDPPPPPHDMVYARSDDVQVGVTTCDGTTNAAPEVASVLDYAWSRRPELSSAAILKTLREALTANNTSLIPQDANGRTMQAFLDQVVARLPLTPCAYVYSAWGACQPNGTQTRTVVSSSPAPCQGSPVLQQSCTYVPPSTVNLKPYQPSGWGSPLVVSKSPGTNLDSSPITPADSLVVDWALVNVGTGAVPVPFSIKLFVDGVLRQGWTQSSMGANTYTSIVDFAIGTLPKGLHTLTLVIDPDNAVAETDETDNQYTKTITVTDPVAGCTVNLPIPSGSIDAAGGFVFVEVQAAADCMWQPTTQVTWITSLGGSGPGNGSFGFRVGENAASTPRTATIEVGNRTYTVQQAGFAGGMCSYKECGCGNPGSCNTLSNNTACVPSMPMAQLGESCVNRGCPAETICQRSRFNFTDKTCMTQVQSTAYCQ